MQYRILLTLLILSFIVPSCNNDKEGIPCDSFEWGYEDEEGPTHWGRCFAECDGSSQSPLDIDDPVPDAVLTALELHYDEVPIDVTNNGHTIEFEYETGSILTLNGLSFNLLQFHFHTESEHTLDGQHFPMEVHLVHKHDATGQLAVIGVFLEEGTENVFLQNFSDNLPAVKDGFFTSSVPVNVADLLPADQGYYTYSGSLTTPPCSETVIWFVMRTPVEASASQIQKFHDILHDNNRPVQSLNGRQIKEF